MQRLQVSVYFYRFTFPICAVFQNFPLSSRRAGSLRIMAWNRQQSGCCDPPASSHILLLLSQLSPANSLLMFSTCLPDPSEPQHLCTCRPSCLKPSSQHPTGLLLYFLFGLYPNDTFSPSLPFPSCFTLPWPLVAQLVKNPPAMRETSVWSLGWEDPLEEGKATHSSILAWRIPWTV